MPSPLDFPARGKILSVSGNIVIFNPNATNYELQLVNQGGQAPVASPAIVSCYIRCQARKVWTMASGGNFITPIFGPPRVVQGRVRYLDETQAVIQAGAPVIVTWPPDPVAFDLANGDIIPGTMINATLLQGATFELAAAVPAAQ
jgi:hypothetical protein